MRGFAEPARPIVEAMLKKIRPIILEAMDECLAERLTQQESVDAILVGLLYQAGFYVAAFERAAGYEISFSVLSRAAKAAVAHGRTLVKEAADA